MSEQLLHSLGSILPASISCKLSPEDSPDAEAADEGCSDLLSVNQCRSTAKDGRRDVCPSHCKPVTAPDWPDAEVSASL